MLKEYEKENKISLVYLCVSKMTNAKFFYSRDNKGDIRNVGNPN